MSAAERGTIIDDIARVPSNSFFIPPVRHVVIRAQDMEIATVRMVDNNRREWLFMHSDHACMDEAGDKQMGGDAILVFGA